MQISMILGLLQWMRLSIEVNGIIFGYTLKCPGRCEYCLSPCVGVSLFLWIFSLRSGGINSARVLANYLVINILNSVFYRDRNIVWFTFGLKRKCDHYAINITLVQAWKSSRIIRSWEISRVFLFFHPIWQRLLSRVIYAESFNDEMFHLSNGK